MIIKIVVAVYLLGQVYCRPEIWPPNGVLKPNNYVPPTTTPLPKLEYRIETVEKCRDTPETVCSKQAANKTIIDFKCLERKNNKTLCKPHTEIKYREKCEVEYLTKCNPVLQNKSREKCEDSYEAKCSVSYKTQYKTECMYTQDCKYADCNEVGPVCHQVPVRRPVNKCTRTPRRICTQVQLPPVHKCESPGIKCRKVGVEVTVECPEIEGEGEEEENCETIVQEEKEVCENKPKKVCTSQQVRVPIIQTLGPTIPVQPFTTLGTTRKPVTAYSVRPTPPSYDHLPLVAPYSSKSNNKQSDGSAAPVYTTNFTEDPSPPTQDQNVTSEPKRYEAGDEEEENLKSGVPKSQTIQDN